MEVIFRAMDELEAGEKWRTESDRRLPAYRAWFLKEGDAARPSYLACVRALRTHMPELMPTYERLVDLAGGGDLAARLLSLYQPTPYLTGCSQAVWTRSDPLLVRNYDYSPHLWDALLLRTAWNGRRVIAMSDCLWGVLDGINDAGLCLSLSFGGSRTIGDGFGMPLILRYVLETCTDATSAVAALRRVPSHMAYNVTLLDARGAYATVYVSPDEPAVVTRRPVATNHQRVIEWRQFAHATASVDRERYLTARRADESETATRFIDRFLMPPLFSTNFHQGWGTLYTAVYQPTRGHAEFRWARHALTQSFARFTEYETTIRYVGGD